MPFELGVPRVLRQQGWKVKILDREGAEEPHATVFFKTWKWRISLRNQRFLDGFPKPSQVPADVLTCIADNLELLRRHWDALHPENPVISDEGE